MEKQLWDIFISHASEDKEEIARPLAKALQQAGLRVWYDEFILKLGDSISDLIREGQNNSTYALIILSPNFFKNEKWARHELKGFMTREVYEGKIIIPVWHNVTPQDVRRFAPDLADKMAVSTSRGLDAVAQQILSIFPEKEKHFREKEKPAKQAKAVQQPQRTPRAPTIHLRNEPGVVSRDDAQKIFGLDADWRPLKYIENDFEDQGDVVIDHRTGLMWQKSGSEKPMPYSEAPAYIKKLNRQRFASYDDWRRPTIPELLSLLEEKRQSNELFINPIFDKHQSWCWSADKILLAQKYCSGDLGPSVNDPLGFKGILAGPVWIVSFTYGSVRWRVGTSNSGVRCVRSRPTP